MATSKRVLVTGAAGFIGSHTVDALLYNEYQVTGLDNFARRPAQNMAHRSNASFTFLRGDLQNVDDVKKALEGVSTVIHLAVMRGSGKTFDEGMRIHETNATGTLQLLRAAVEAGVRRFVFASSATVYGKRNEPPHGEDMLPHPESSYAASKIAAEGYCTAFRSMYGLETVVLRYMNVYGPRAQNDDHASVVVKFADRLLQNQPPYIFGDDEQSRDFTYVEDVAKANLLAIQSEGAVGEIINIGTGRPTTIKELAEEMAKLLNIHPIRPILKLRRPWDIQTSWADIGKARTLLGYEPETNLTQGLRRFLEWYKGTLKRF
jgi:nucleoside-diphosphate-sugar epimerase